MTITAVNQPQSTGSFTNMGPKIALNEDHLSMDGIVLVWHKIRKNDLGVDAKFHVHTWAFNETMLERLEMFDEYSHDEETPLNEELREIAESDSEICLKEAAQGSLAEIGIPEIYHRDVRIVEKGDPTIVEITCSFLLETPLHEYISDKPEPLCPISVDATNFTFTADTSGAIITAAMDVSGDYIKCKGFSPLEKFGLMEAVCLPWHMHWLLDRGYDVSTATVGSDTRFHVHFHDYRIIPESGDVDDIDPYNLVLLTHESYPFLP
jgi:hypothetical protein